MSFNYPSVIIRCRHQYPADAYLIEDSSDLVELAERYMPDNGIDRGYGVETSVNCQNAVDVIGNDTKRLIIIDRHNISQHYDPETETLRDEFLAPNSLRALPRMIDRMMGFQF